LRRPQVKPGPPQTLRRYRCHFAKPNDAAIDSVKSSGKKKLENLERKQSRANRKIE
jgi:hypothetical protein